MAHQWWELGPGDPELPGDSHHWVSGGQQGFREYDPSNHLWSVFISALCGRVLIKSETRLSYKKKMLVNIVNVFIKMYIYQKISNGGVRDSDWLQDVH